MFKLKAELRKEKKAKKIRESGKIPAILYGPKIKNVPLMVDYQEFIKVFQKAGESTLLELLIEGEEKKRLVLIHEIQKDPVTDNIIHIDFFQPSLKEEVEVEIPIVFEGISPAVKDLGGTLVKNISNVKIKALPQDLIHEIKVSVEKLKTFEDRILIKDLKVPKEVKILLDENEIVALVTPPEKVEEELAEKIEEKVEEVQKVEKEKKKEEIISEETSTQ